jgi:sugar/nucleoside kinase (ribokinase family)
VKGKTVAKLYDLIVAGNIVLDEIHPFGAPMQTFCGGPVMFGGMAAQCCGKRIAVVTKAAERELRCLDRLRAHGIETYVSVSPETTTHRVVHHTDNVDEREMLLLRSAGYFAEADFADLEPTVLHLAGLNDQEFTLEFVREMSGRGFALCVDMQAFVRKVDPVSGEIRLADVDQKEEIARRAYRVKLDLVEAEHLMGTNDVERAAMQFETWGTPETMVTQADGVLVRNQGTTYFEAFSNRSVEGRTGRGDTTFAAYSARRLDHDVPEALKFAAALASIKMESPGTFSGTIDDVLGRLRADHLQTG